MNGSPLKLLFGMFTLYKGLPNVLQNTTQTYGKDIMFSPGNFANLELFTTHAI